MTVAAIDRSLEQRFESLKLANEIRFARARMKRDLVARRADAVELLTDPPGWLRTMRVTGFLVSIPRTGPAKTRRLMMVCRIADGKTVGGLSDRQRCELVGELRRARVA